MRILDAVDAAAEAVRSESATPAGRMKVSLPTSFAIAWLSGRLPALLADANDLPKQPDERTVMLDRVRLDRRYNAPGRRSPSST